MPTRNGTPSDAAAAPAQASKPRSKAWIWIVVVVVVVLGAGGGGAVAGAKWLAKSSPKAHAEGSEGGSEDEAEEALETVSLGDVVVDVRGEAGEQHHLKVGISVELKPGVAPEMGKALIPKGRETVIVFLRTKTFEDLTGPGTFSKVVEELDKRVVAAFGAKRAKRILVTDYLSQ